MFDGPWRDVQARLHLTEAHAFSLVEDIFTAELSCVLVTFFNFVAGRTWWFILWWLFLDTKAAIAEPDVRPGWTWIPVYRLEQKKRNEVSKIGIEIICLKIEQRTYRVD